MLYIEQIFNLELFKFVINWMIYKGIVDFWEEVLVKEWFLLVIELFEMFFVKGVYICNNFVIIIKEFNYDWVDIMFKVKEYFKGYIGDEKFIIRDGFEVVMVKIEEECGVSYDYIENEVEIVKKIKDLIDIYVKFVVEMDGGNIEFKFWDQGKVMLVMQGVCSGCFFFMVILKQGIEGMLQWMIFEVKEVVVEMGQFVYSELLLC